MLVGRPGRVWAGGQGAALRAARRVRRPGGMSLTDGHFQLAHSGLLKGSTGEALRWCAALARILLLLFVCI